MICCENIVDVILKKIIQKKKRINSNMLIVLKLLTTTSLFHILSYKNDSYLWFSQLVYFTSFHIKVTLTCGSHEMYFYMKYKFSTPNV